MSSPAFPGPRNAPARALPPAPLTFLARSSSLQGTLLFCLQKVRVPLSLSNFPSLPGGHQMPEPAGVADT